MTCQIPLAPKPRKPANPSVPAQSLLLGGPSGDSCTHFTDENTGPSHRGTGAILDLRPFIHSSRSLRNRCVLTTYYVLEALGEVSNSTHRITRRCKEHLDAAVNELRLPIQYFTESSL